MMALLGIIVVLVLGIWGVVAWQASYARSLEAQVALTAQRSAAASNAVLTVVLGLIIAALLAVIGLYLYVQVRRFFGGVQGRPGSRRVSRGTLSRAQEREALSSGGGTNALVEQLVQLQLLQLMRDLGAQQRALPRDEVEVTLWQG